MIERAGAVRRLHFAVVIPAHNEAAGIGNTLRSLESVDYRRERVQVVVVADNCTDNTAELARRSGATVFERNDRARVGKGYALAWGLSCLLANYPDVEAIAVLDADCRPSSNLLAAMDAHLGAGERAVQTDCVVSNPAESWASGLRYTACALFNTVRPQGEDALGLSSGLRGTGMGFTRALVEQIPWTAFSLVEDAEYHARLVLAGERVRYIREAWVSSPMPTSLRRARTQQLRWETGKWQLIRSLAPRLALAGLRRRDPVRLHAALEMAVPPLSLLWTAELALAAFALCSKSRASTRLAVANFLGQAIYVLGGLAFARAPFAAYRSLAMAPVLAAWKLRLWADVVRGSGAQEWTRTERGGGPAR